MRDLNKVMDEIVDVSTNEELNNMLEKFKRKIPFKAPELHYELWNEVGNILGVYYPNPVASQESLEIASIFTTKSKEEIQRLYGEVL